MKPYYEQDGITIYHGDCLEVLPTLSRFDLLATDPPYGIKAVATGRVGGRNLAPVTDYGAQSWDDATCEVAIALARSISQWHIVFGGNYYHLPPSSCWLVWDKDNGASNFADCELAWTNLPKAVRKLTYRWNGMLQQPGRPKECRQHPTQKPEPVMVWAISHAPKDAHTVLDPFMGSGTTLVASKRLGKLAVGIEREERYCEIAAKRLAQGALQMFDASPA